MIDRRRCLLTGLAFLLIAGTAARAHHGPMPWDRSEIVVLDGIVVQEMDGFPHWEISLRVDGVDWSVDVGDNFTLERAGLAPDGSDFSIGRRVIIEGYRPLDPAWHRLLPQRIIIDGTTYDIRLHGE